jgi:hypothetical protein
LALYLVYAMSPDPRAELTILYEKMRALETLMRYERDIDSLKFYKRELDAVVAQLRKQEIASPPKKPAKVLPFAPKKPVRSA